MRVSELLGSVAHINDAVMGAFDTAVTENLSYAKSCAAQPLAQPELKKRTWLGVTVLVPRRVLAL